MFNYASLTKNGAALITRAINGEKFVFTRMEYGNGIPSEFNASQTSEEIKSILSERTSLVSKKADIGMYSISTKNNCATLTGKIISSSLTEDFLAKELGVFGKIGEEAEVLVAYFIATESPDPINQAALVGQEHKIIVNVATGNAADITIEYSPEIYATKEDFDALVASNAEEHTEIRNLIDEKIGSIDISSALSHIKQYDFVVDSNESLLAWANCTDGSMKSVLVKSGEYMLEGKMINLVNAGTKFVFAEDGNKIAVSEYMRGIGATEDYGAVIVGLNVEVKYRGTGDCHAFYRGMICYNCTGTGTSNDTGNGYGFYACTCSNCTGTGTGKGNGDGVGFYDCKHCSSCRAGKTASTKATWGGTNTYIDSDSCDYVAA